MTTLLKSQRLLAEPVLAPGVVLECEDYDGRPVRFEVTWPQPPGQGGRWVNGRTDGGAAVVWLSW